MEILAQYLFCRKRCEHLAVRKIKIYRNLIFFARIPIFVQRPAFAGKARCPTPEMCADRTQTACFKRIPFGITGIVKIFGIIAIGAPPAARFFRLPFTQRTTDAAEIGFNNFLFGKLTDYFVRLRSFFEKRIAHHFSG